MAQAREASTVIKILSNPHRFAIMALLLRSKKDLCVNEIAAAVGISQSLASHQLAYLEAHGVLVGHRMGQTTCYMPSQSSALKKIERIVAIFS